MSTHIEALPYDIVHSIAGQIDLRSYIALSRVNKHFYQLLQNEATARKCFQNEIKLGQRDFDLSKHPFPQTISLVHDYRESVSTARPYSVSTIARATSFVYNQETLCYTTDDELRVLSLTEDTKHELVIDTWSLVGKAFGTSRSRYRPILKLYSYSDSVLTLTCTFSETPISRLLAIRITATDPIPDTRILCILRLLPQDLSKLFILHTPTHLLYGTHTARNAKNHHEWLLHLIELQTSQSVPGSPFQIHDFIGSDLGTTCAFTIHKDHFYAVTNQTSYESEEVDWTSYYHYIKLPVSSTAEFPPDLGIRTIWRRQHAEGPINDAWTELGFQVESHTGELLVVECRKEWLGGGTDCVRTWYVEPIERYVGKHGQWAPQAPNSFPPDDVLASTLEEGGSSRWEESPGVRIERWMHIEREVGGVEVGEYRKAKNRWNGYRFDAQCFVDLVVDDVVVDGWRSRERLRMRVVRRVERSPLIYYQDADGGEVRWKVRAKVKDKDGEEIEDSDITYEPHQVSLWPENDASNEVWDVLCPSGNRVGRVQAQIGQRGLIFAVEGNEEMDLILISFDPNFGWEGMRRADGTAVTLKPSTESDRPQSHAVERPPDGKRKAREEPELGSRSPGAARSSRIDKGKKKAKLESTMDVDEEYCQLAASDDDPGASPAGSQSSPLVWWEKALYLTIDRPAFWLR